MPNGYGTALPPTEREWTKKEAHLRNEIEKKVKIKIKDGTLLIMAGP